MTHFLDPSGNIPKEMPKEAREIASFFALVVDETTKKSSNTSIQTEIRCFEKKCDGLIQTDYLKESKEIHWKCSKCPNEGIISHWQKTRWDNRYM